MKIPDYDENYVVGNREELISYIKSLGYPIYTNKAYPHTWFIGFPSIRECLLNKYPLAKLSDSLSDEGMCIGVNTNMYLSSYNEFRRIF